MLRERIRQLKKYVIFLPLFGLAFSLFFPAPVNAMHIAEGILPASWAGI